MFDYLANCDIAPDVPGILIVELEFNNFVFLVSFDPGLCRTVDRCVIAGTFFFKTACITIFTGGSSSDFFIRSYITILLTVSSHSTGLECNPANILRPFVLHNL